MWSVVLFAVTVQHIGQVQTTQTLAMDVFIPQTCENYDNISWTVLNNVTRSMDINITLHDSCDEAKTVNRLVNIFTLSPRQSNHIIIGPAAYSLCHTVANLAAYYDKAVISWRCATGHLHKVLLRTSPSHSITSTAVSLLLTQFLWKRLTIVSSSRTPCWQFTSELYLNLAGFGYIINQLIELPQDLSAYILPTISTDSKGQLYKEQNNNFTIFFSFFLNKFLIFLHHSLKKKNGSGICFYPQMNLI